MQDLELLDAEVLGLDLPGGLDAGALAADAAQAALSLAAPAAEQKAAPPSYGVPSPGAAAQATARAATQAALETAQARPRASSSPSEPGRGQKVLSTLERLSKGFADFVTPGASPAPAPAPVVLAEEPGWLDGDTGPVPNKVIAGVGAAAALGLALRALTR